MIHGKIVNPTVPYHKHEKKPEMKITGAHILSYPEKKPRALNSYVLIAQNPSELFLTRQLIVVLRSTR